MTERTQLRRRRGVTQASITRLQSRLADLEHDPGRPGVLESAQQILSKLKDLEADYKRQHLAIIDITEEERDLLDEQATLDRHDDEVAALVFVLNS